MKILYLGREKDEIGVIKSKLFENLGSNMVFDSATTIDKCIEMLKRVEYDLIILNESLTWVCGFDVLDRISENNNQIPVVYITSESDETVAVEALKRGVRDYFTKNQIETGRFVQSIKNIKKRSDAERELKLSKENYKSIFENSAVAIMIADKNENIISWNSFSEKLLGMDFNDLFRKPVPKLYPREEWDLIRKKNIRQLGFKEHVETKMYRKDGSIIDVDLSLSVIKDDMGEVTGSIGIIQDITKSKKAAEAILDSEQKYRSLVESSEDLIYQIDEKLNFLHANKKYLDRVNLTLEEILKINYLKLHPPNTDPDKEGRTPFSKRIHMIFETGKPNVYEHKSLRDNKYYLRTLSPIIDSTGKITSVIVNSKDITGEKSIQGQLRKFMMAVEQSTISVIITDPELKIEYVNKKYCQLTGYVGSARINTSVNENFWEFTGSNFLEIIGLIKGGDTWSGEVKTFRSDGGTYWSLLNISPITDGKGNLVHILFSGENITKRKKAQQQIKKLEEFFENIAYSINSAIAVADLSGGILTWNQEAEELWGLKAHDVLGKKIDEIILPKEFGAFSDSMKGVIDTGVGRRDTDIKFDKVGRQTIFADVTYNPLLNMSGELLGAIAFAYDVSERNKAKEELIKYDRMKDEFLSITTHELKTPLTPLKIQIEMWKNGLFGVLDEKGRKSVDIMHRNCIREIHLINDIMTISKIDQQKLKFKLECVEIVELIHNVKEDMEGEATKKGIKLCIELPNEKIVVNADSQRLMQVIVDLINNALKFTEDGEVRVKVVKKGDDALVSIKDTGIGIPENELQNIFERFYQVDHTITRKYYGSGLGLAIVKAIVEMHKGKIWVESVLGKGTTFHFTIPLYKINY